MQEPPQRPGPYDDFAFAFDPALHNIYPSPTPLPSSADLFSPSETTDLYGFLESLNYDLEAERLNAVHVLVPKPKASRAVAAKPTATGTVSKIIGTERVDVFVFIWHTRHKLVAGADETSSIHPTKEAQPHHVRAETAKRDP
ncbi:hypothetical protein NM688_g1871 [Phlebia brevispora]|uniref:Uncharacterized protein n=1 Tax=Phlebia brevispora TaxID=194682 RepID=A0ACC1TA30_9APHY|nr:hypothetical protein NM688_g1871 [Phlebia brevispora]